MRAALQALMLLLCILAPSTKSALVAKPTILSLTASTKRVPAKGGTVTLVATVRSAARCVFDDVAEVNCSAGIADYHFRVFPNFDDENFAIHHWIAAYSAKGESRRAIVVVQSGIGRRTCIDRCWFRFIVPSGDGLDAIRLDSTTTYVHCRPVVHCSRSSSRIGIRLAFTLCASNAGTSMRSAIRSVVLVAPRRAHVRLDRATYEKGGLGSLAVIPPDRCVSGPIYFNLAAAVRWSKVEYRFAAPRYFAHVRYFWIRS